MATFFMFGKYSTDALKGISSERTTQVSELIQNLGGEVKTMHALLGAHDLVLLVDLPGTNEALKASLGATRLTGISFTTAPAVEAKEFDRLAAQA